MLHSSQIITDVENRTLDKYPKSLNIQFVSTNLTDDASLKLFFLLQVLKKKDVADDEHDDVRRLDTNKCKKKRGVANVTYVMFVTSDKTYQ